LKKNRLIQQGCIKLIKSDSQDTLNQLIKESWKKVYLCFHKNIKQHNCF